MALKIKVKTAEKPNEFYIFGIINNLILHFKLKFSTVKTSLYFFLYSLVIGLATPLIFLYLLFRSRKDKRYRKYFLERFGWINSTALHKSRGAVVIHAASVGEVEASVSLIQSILELYPHLPIIVTCNTPTGRQRIQNHFAERVLCYYLPIDASFSIKPWLQRIQPSLVLLIETELWPNLIRSCYAINTPTLLINARLSARSAQGYRRYAPLVKPMLTQLSAVLTQDTATLKRFKALGVKRNIEVMGNLKFELQASKAHHQMAVKNRTLLSERLIWIAASTHKGEEELCLQAYQALSQDYPKLLLVLVPRHPERFTPVTDLVATMGLQGVRYSQDLTDADHAQVIVGDTMGDMMMWYELAHYVFMGGSLVEHGGHNPLEALYFGKPVMTGQHTFNFKHIYSHLNKHNILSQVTNLSDITTTLTQWLNHPKSAQTQGQKGYQWFASQTGAKLNALEQIKCFLTERSQLRYSYHKNAFLLGNTTALPELSSNYFNEAYWHNNNQLMGSSQGRNRAWFVSLNQHEMVLRHYYRGGLIRHISQQTFFGFSIIQMRSIKELYLLTFMRSQGLLVPKPLAARVCPQGWRYQADILLEKIPNAIDIYSKLFTRSMTAQMWQHLGQTIARMHELGVDHTDLNCRNIMLDTQQQFWLIDFDKCQRRLNGSWQDKNLQRLKRSLQKEKSNHTAFFWSESDWFELMKGYKTWQQSPPQT